MEAQWTAVQKGLDGSGEGAGPWGGPAWARFVVPDFRLVAGAGARSRLSPRGSRGGLGGRLGELRAAERGLSDFLTAWARPADTVERSRSVGTYPLT